MSGPSVVSCSGDSSSVPHRFSRATLGGSSASLSGLLMAARRPFQNSYIRRIVLMTFGTKQQNKNVALWAPFVQLYRMDRVFSPAQDKKGPHLFETIPKSPTKGKKLGVT